MTDDAAIWYLPGESGQAVGPFATADVLARCRAGELSGAVLCWRQGMPDWMPLAEVEPFSELTGGLAGDPAGQGFDDLGKAFGRAIDFTKRKAKIASLRVTIGKHEKRREQLFAELGRMVYRQQGQAEFLSQEPYADTARQIRVDDESIESLRRQIESIERAGRGAGSGEGT
jgi:hypothetical protein